VLVILIKSKHGSTPVHCKTDLARDPFPIYQTTYKMKKNPLRVIVAIVIIALASGIYVWKYLYNKPHPDYLTIPADVSVDANTLFNAFVADQALAESTYNGKVVEITGVPSGIEQSDSLQFVVFVFRQGDFGDEGIRCALHPRAVKHDFHLTPDKPVTLKGYLTGFNGSDVIFEKCSFVE